MNNLQEQLQNIKTQENGYAKSHKTFDEQLKILKERDLIVSNDEYAVTKLNHINYYRLSAYFLLNTSFEDVIKLSHSDTELKYILTCIGEDEVEFKEKIKQLLQKYLHVDKNVMGFVHDWEKLGMKKRFFIMYDNLFKDRSRK